MTATEDVRHIVHVLDTSGHVPSVRCPCGPHPARDLADPAGEFVALHLAWSPVGAGLPPAAGVSSRKHSGRPRGTESVTEAEVRDSVARLVRRRVRVTREAVAADVGLSDPGLRDYHRRRGEPWPAFLSRIYPSLPRTCDPAQPVEDGRMRLTIEIPQAEADELRGLAQAEHRDTRSQARSVFSDGLRVRRLMAVAEPETSSAEDGATAAGIGLEAKE